MLSPVAAFNLSFELIFSVWKETFFKSLLRRCVSVQLHEVEYCMGAGAVAKSSPTVWLRISGDLVGLLGISRIWQQQPSTMVTHKLQPPRFL